MRQYGYLCDGTDYGNRVDTRVGKERFYPARWPERFQSNVKRREADDTELGLFFSEG